MIVGLGREGSALAGYLTRHGLLVTITDAQPAEKLSVDLTHLQTAGVTLVLGEHPASLFDQTDILFVSPGVPLTIPFLQEARARRLPLTTETKLFSALCPAPIIGITGSSGKTTTTTLVGHMIEAAGWKTWVGGNIGRPLIELVDQIKAEDKVVMELSSFQLEYFHAKLNQGVALDRLSPDQAQVLSTLLDNWSPPVSAILNITPNHLDRHASMKEYVYAKRAMINYQGPQGRLVMNLDNDMTRTIGAQFGSRTRWFSLEAELPRGASLVQDQIALLDENSVSRPVVHRREVKLRGRHNLSNILAACLLADETGVPIETMRQVVTTFTGVEHRLQLIREYQGVWYFNDSIATSPERLMAALRSFSEPIVLLAGGRDKHLPWDEAVRLIIQKTHTVILFGEAAPLIADALAQAAPEITNTTTTVHRCPTLAEAVAIATQEAQAGDVVLLSPGCTSFDAFRSFAERGERFKELVLGL